MQITGIQFRSIEARRYQDPTPNAQIRIDHNSSLNMVARESDDRLRIEFGYTTSYGPLGMVKLEGVMGVQNAGAGALAETWAQTRNLPPELAQAVHSAIMSAAVPEAVGLAKDLRLPPPIPLPQIQFQKPATAGATTKAGEYNPEVG